MIILPEKIIHDVYSPFAKSLSPLLFLTPLPTLSLLRKIVIPAQAGTGVHGYARAEFAECVDSRLRGNDKLRPRRRGTLGYDVDSHLRGNDKNSN